MKENLPIIDPITNVAETIKETVSVEPKNFIPPQYEGLPSETVEEMWTKEPDYKITGEKNTVNQNRREAGLAQIREREETREIEKGKFDEERYSRLSEDQKSKFPSIQKDMAQLVAEHIKGTREIENLTGEERRALLKAEDAWKDSQEKNPGAPLTIKFGKEIDNKVYENLLNRLAFGEIKVKKAEADKEALNKVRQDLGMTPIEETDETLNKVDNVLENDSYDHKVAQEIKGVFNNLGLGANGGLKDDFENKIQKYADEIKSGKDKKSVLQGLPKSFTEAIEKKLELNKNSTQKQGEQLSAEEEKIGANNSENSLEKEISFKEQMKDFLQIIIKDEDIKKTMDKYRSRPQMLDEPEKDFKARQSTNDLEIMASMSNKLYDMVHESGMSQKEVTDGIKVPNKDEFIKNFDTEIKDKLADVVKRSSEVRYITEKELIDGGQPDQTNFVWFKGNAPKPHNARETRFYINASPDGTIETAEYLSKLSDQLSKYGLRLNFKFRKTLGEYNRTDTCVAYLYMPEAKTEEQKEFSDKWVEKIKGAMAQIPKDAIRNKNSFFTDRIGDGVSFAEDTREAEGKKKESYTSQIAASIAESSGELSKQYSSLTPEVMEQITLRTTEKLKQMNYF